MQVWLLFSFTHSTEVEHFRPITHKLRPLQLTLMIPSCVCVMCYCGVTREFILFTVVVFFFDVMTSD